MSWPVTNALKKNAYAALSTLENDVTNLKDKINVASNPPLTKAIVDFINSEESSAEEKILFQAALDSCTAITSEITSQGL